MLAIGGMTVDELKERMTNEELQRWISYAEVYGPLNPILRSDFALARLCAMWGNGKPKSYMPWPKEPEKEASIEDAFAVLKNARRNSGTQIAGDADAGLNSKARRIHARNGPRRARRVRPR